MALRLVRPTLDMERQFHSFIEEWERAGEEIVPYSVTLRGMTYPEWVADAERCETDPPEGKVAAHTYFLMDGVTDGILGAVNIRHTLNDYLLRYGGHIGYGIRPSCRRRGYAIRMLALALDAARRFGLKRVLVTCDKNNVGSARTIQKNGGVLENEVINDEETTQRYWIDL